MEALSLRQRLYGQIRLTLQKLTCRYELRPLHRRACRSRIGADEEIALHDLVADIDVERLDLSGDLRADIDAN
ncbi:MAG: hypothetical protein U1E87_08045 [Alphaproteobacteria bacterium]